MDVPYHSIVADVYCYRTMAEDAERRSKLPRSERPVVPYYNDINAPGDLEIW